MATLADVRAVVSSLPRTTEKPSYGTPGFRVADKLFARVRDDGSLMAYVGTESEKVALIAAEPDVFFTTPHYDGYAVVLVRLDAIADDELEEVLTDAWLARAPKQLRAEWESTDR